MVVHTHSERLIKYRQMILELLFCGAQPRLRGLRA